MAAREALRAAWYGGDLAGYEMFLCTPLVVPPESGVSREMTRPPQFRGADFAEHFDHSTLFYDLVDFSDAHGSGLLFIGPPLLNFHEYLIRGRIDADPLKQRMFRYYARDRCCDVWIRAKVGRPVRMEFDFGVYHLTPQSTGHELYRGKRVLYTLSKDNELAWIIDWIQFHAANQGADAALIYDNGSARYSCQHLEESLRATFPRLAVNVVSWPFKYGPGGFSRTSWWDSDFCQAAAFQDARFRFLHSAASVLNCDVDELVVSEGGGSIFSAAERSSDGYVAFYGSWISNAITSTLDRSMAPASLRHCQFCHLEQSGARACPTKWCVVPTRCRLADQWRTHSVTGKPIGTSESSKFSYRHFRSISTNWKYQRWQPTLFDPALHRYDETLSRALALAQQGALP
jgi:hypothetical protein